MRKQTREQSLVKSNEAPEEVGFYALLSFLFAHRIFWFSNVIYYLCSTFIEMIVYMLLMLCLVHWYNLHLITISMLLIHEQSSPHTLIYLVGKLHHIVVEFTSMVHKVFVEILVHMHMLWYWWNCVRGVPPRSRMMLLMNLCEGSPPKITYGTYYVGYNVEKRYMHVTCRFLVSTCRYMPLDDFLKFSAICTLIVNPV